MKNTRDAIRKETGIIIRREGKYLVGTILYSTDLRWSWSPYDAWKTRKVRDAQMVAGATGGEMVLFNPILGRMKEMESDDNGD